MVTIYCSNSLNNKGLGRSGVQNNVQNSAQGETEDNSNKRSRFHD